MEGTHRGSHICACTHLVYTQRLISTPLVFTHTHLECALTRIHAQAGHSSAWGKWSEQPQSCCDSDVAQVSNPVTAGCPTESTLRDKEKKSAAYTFPSSLLPRGSCFASFWGQLPISVADSPPEKPQVSATGFFLSFSSTWNYHPA